MKPFHSWIWVCVFTLAPGALALPQQDVVKADSVEIATGQSAALAASAEVSVLRLVKLSGVVNDALGQPRTGVVGITFALYQEQEGGAPLWLETQNAELDAQGRYAVLLGAESSEGLPLEIFSSTEARWLGVTVQGEEEQSRVLLVSVPYALKAADAERLGGQLAATFVSKDPETGQLLAGGEVLESSALAVGGGTSPQVVSGNAGFIAKFLIFRNVIAAGYTWWAVAGLIGSYLGIYFYLRVIQYMFMSADAPAGESRPVGGLVLAASLICIVPVLLLTVFPGWLLDRL